MRCHFRASRRVRVELHHPKPDGRLSLRAWRVNGGAGIRQYASVNLQHKGSNLCQLPYHVHEPPRLRRTALKTIGHTAIRRQGDSIPSRRPPFGGHSWPATPRPDSSPRTRYGLRDCDVLLPEAPCVSKCKTSGYNALCLARRLCPLAPDLRYRIGPTHREACCMPMRKQDTLLF